MAPALGALPPAVMLLDGGGELEFEVSCTELHCRPKDGLSHPLMIPDQGTAARTAELAEKMSAKGDAVFDLVLYRLGKPRVDAHRRSLDRRVLVEMRPGADPAAIARQVGASAFKLPHYSERHLILSFPKAGDSLNQLDAIRALADVANAHPLLGRKNRKKLVPNDPRYAWSPTNTSYQWHLNNTGQNGSPSGLDVNIIGVWDSYLGNGVTISIVDDGLDTTHPDLSANVNTAIDHDWNDATPNDPRPFNNVDDHGTSCAGVAAARGNNGVGVSGAAPQAELVGLRLIADSTTDAEDAEALAWRTDVIDISSNSWGQGDSGFEFFSMGPLTTAALANGVTNGRNGKGTIYVWAGGNGRDDGDYANYDGYNNAVETIAVGAIDFSGEQSWYSESGANLLISAPSDAFSNDPAITTTTLVSKGSYTNDFGGTSSATPLVAGVVALMLEANPDLGWRDVQEILIRSATKIDASDAGWSDNGAGFHFHHGFGAGMVDADAAVALATTWVNLGSAQTVTAASGAINPAIPDNNPAGVTSTLSLSGTDLRAEHVQLTVDIDHSYRGDLILTLSSPDGTVSRFTELHGDDNADISNYTFMSVRHWGEMANGDWTFKAVDAAGGDIGAIRSLTLEVSGTEPLTGYDAWAATNITGGAPAGPSDDADIDGRDNLEEYAFGGDPMVPDDPGNPTLLSSGGPVRLRYVADTSKTDIDYAMRVSTNLVNWSTVPSSLISTDGPLETRELVLEGNGDRFFARVQYTRLTEP
ncbi:MAG: S8 family peptidase [Verrucomicrobiota bacterium]